MTTSTEVVRNGNGAGLVMRTLTEEQIGLVKRTILQPKNRVATDDELALFIGQCERTGLDPFARQIYGIYRKQDGREKMTIQTGIDGFRLIAQRSGTYAGQDGPFWLDDTGQWHASWPKKTPAPVAAKVIVRKVIGGHVVETPAIANFEEFAPRYSGKLQGLWPQMPAHMIAKVAEALALRKAFPQELSGIYTVDEMEASEIVEAVEVKRPELPVIEPLVTPADVEELKAAATGLTAGKLRLIFGSQGLDIEHDWALIPKSKATDLALALVEAERPQA
ncbi:MAG TPA: phage recombination protein Bet [Solirubrobacteraceae bacterium]|jgi:phage recombination protein Bet|nr:phage recombination protein Bet [Solirubrobacteraceae bacterium]